MKMNAEYIPQGRLRQRTIAFVLVFFCLGAHCLSGRALVRAADDPFAAIQLLATPQEKISRCKEVLLRPDITPAVAAKARLVTGQQFELLGKPVEASSEYLKIILNYAAQEETAQQAEERLKEIYNVISTTTPNDPQAVESKTIFLSYLKSLCETYKQQGRYNKAIELLKRLGRYDADLPSSYAELAAIYLDGLNNFDLAIDYYGRVLELEPDNVKAYFGLGQAYRKKGQLDKAVEYYRKTVALGGALPSGQYAADALVSLDLAARGEFVTAWYILGPFPTRVDPKVWVKRNISLDDEYVGANAIPVRWSKLPADPYDGYLNFNKIFPENDFVLAYALTYIYSPSPRTDVVLNISTDSPLQVWVDTDIVFSRQDADKGYVPHDRYQVTVSLRKGWNRVLLRSATTWGSWGIMLRVSDEHGAPPTTLIVDPDRDMERVGDIYRELMRVKVVTIGTYVLLYGTAVVVFLFGVILALVNLRNKIRISKMKADFISNVSHQLKTPLTSIKMFAESLKMGKVANEEKVKQYLDLIIRESDRLTHFVNTVLTFQKIGKKNVYRFKNENLIELIEGVIADFRKEADTHSAEITFSWESVPPLALDRDLFAEAMRNLIDNALKYSVGQKRVRVTVSLSRAFVVIDVADHGIGIPTEDLARLFDEFYRASNRPHSVKGTGLGLNFVKSIVEEHRGTIGVKSEEGQGSTFTIRLPLPSTAHTRAG